MRGHRGRGTGKVIAEAPIWGVTSPFKGSSGVRGLPLMAPLVLGLQGSRGTRVNKVIPGVGWRALPTGPLLHPTGDCLGDKI